MGLILVTSDDALYSQGLGVTCRYEGAEARLYGTQQRMLELPVCES